MKRFFVFFLLIVLMSGNVFANENDINDNGKYITFDDYLIYDIYATDFFSFVEHPCLSVLDSVCVSKYCYLWYNYNEDLLRGRDELSDNVKYLGYEESISDLYYLQKENIYDVLKKNNVNKEINTIALINILWNDYDVFPNVIWINTNNNENFYIISESEPIGFFQENGDLPKVMPFSENGIFLTQNEFAEKFEWKTGDIYIDNNKIDTQLLPIFFSSTVRIPIRTVLESLGFEVSYDVKNHVIFAEDNNKKYAILLNTEENLKRNHIDEYEDDIIQVQYFEPIYRKDGYLYISGFGWFKDFMELFDKNYVCNVDFTKRSVNLLRE